MDGRYPMRTLVVSRCGGYWLDKYQKEGRNTCMNSIHFRSFGPLLFRWVLRYCVHWKRKVGQPHIYSVHIYIYEMKLRIYLIVHGKQHPFSTT